MIEKDNLIHSLFRRIREEWIGLIILSSALGFLFHFPVDDWLTSHSLFKNADSLSFFRLVVHIVFIVLILVIFALCSLLADHHIVVNYVLIVVIAETFLLYYSVSTSPLYGHYYGGDSAFFILVGKAMKYGYLPYRDFFDMKGPWLFVTEWIGQMIAEGRMGAFFLQSINLSGCLIMFFKLFGLERKQQNVYEISLLLPMLYTAIFSVGGGNLTEELSFFPLSICLYLGVKYLISDDNNHKPIHAGVYGICFGYLALVRITNAAILCAIVLTIVLSLIVKKKWVNLVQNAVAFVVGMLISVLPITLFFAVNRILKDMLYQVFGYGFLYAGGDNKVGWVKLFTGNYRDSLCPLIISLVISLLFFKRHRWSITLLIWASTFATMAAIALGGRNFEHYYGLLVPVVALDIWFIWHVLCKQFYLRTEGEISSESRRKLSIVLLCIIVFISSFYGTYRLDQDYVEKVVHGNHNDDRDIAIEDIAQKITNDGTVYAWTSQPRWYMYADRFPSFKYCGWQTDQMAVDPSVGRALSDMFLNSPPEWLVLENNDNDRPQFVNQSIGSFFSETYRNPYWILYHRKNNEKAETVSRN